MQTTSSVNARSPSMKESGFRPSCARCIAIANLPAGAFANAEAIDAVNAAGPHTCKDTSTPCARCDADVVAESAHLMWRSAHGPAKRAAERAAAAAFEAADLTGAHVCKGGNQ